MFIQCLRDSLAGLSDFSINSDGEVVDKIHSLVEQMLVMSNSESSSDVEGNILSM